MRTSPFFFVPPSRTVRPERAEEPSSFDVAEEKNGVSISSARPDERTARPFLSFMTALVYVNVKLICGAGGLSRAL
jgi:hypothetical protein